MVVAILAVLSLFVVQTFLPSLIRYLGGGPGTGRRLLMALGPRDEQPPLTHIGERAQRALANMQEALPVFLALALLDVMRGTQEGQAVHGAWVFLIARLVYVPAYLIGVPGLRSLIWGVSWIGLAMMLTQLF
jgi:uncharacterized MAPEG superfamily protein